MCYFKEGSCKPQVRTSDTPENRALWAELAPSAQSLLADVERTVGRGAFNKQAGLFALALEALMYATASKGILAAVASGCAPSFLLRVAKYEELHPEWDGYQYCVYRGAYFLAAPWPVCNAEKGRAFLELSAQNAPASRRNQYFAGVGRFATGDFAGAREAMERALQEPSPTPS